MIVLAIIGLLMAVVIPMTRNWMGNREVSEAGDRLQADLRQAASLASTNGADVNFSGTATGGVTNGYCIWKGGNKTTTTITNLDTNIRVASNFNQVNGAIAGTNIIFYRNGAAIGGFGFLANGYVVNANGGAAVGGEIMLDNGRRSIRIRVTRTGSIALDQVTPGTAAANI